MIFYDLTVFIIENSFVHDQKSSRKILE